MKGCVFTESSYPLDCGETCKMVITNPDAGLGLMQSLFD